jgi:pimeloyl-ACP methyl ester carboxylesterase
MSASGSRHFATLGRRQIHYRRAGAGPVVVLLHQSPASSAEMLPLLEELAQRFTVIAPDMPGYGASDPLPDALSMRSLADNLAAFMDELGIEAAALYGFHTGASLATAFARMHPQRVVAVIAEGLLCLEQTERSEWQRRYLEPFVPRWDGAHLAWLWSRMKDQSVFFPWYERSAAARLTIDAAPSSALFARALDWLRSGEGYWQGYAAAMAYDPRDDLGAITTPHHIVCQRGDPLAAHLERLPPLAENVSVELLAGPQQRTARVLALMSKYCIAEAAPSPVPARAIAGEVWQDYVGPARAQLRVMRAGTPSAAPVVVQHGAQNSLRACRDLIAGLGATRAAIAVELPGHGASDPPATQEEASIESCAEPLAAALEACGVTAYDWIGMGAGAAIGVQLAHTRPRSLRSLTLVAPLDLTANLELREALIDSYAAAQGDAHGGYLLKAWHEVRDHQLFFPWFERRRACAAADTTLLDPAWLQARTLDLLEAGVHGVAVRRSELRYPLIERLAAGAGRACFAAPPWEPRFAHVRAIAPQAAHFVRLDGGVHGWPAQLAATNRSSGEAPRALRDAGS